jgi:hypothetical protein
MKQAFFIVILLNTVQYASSQVGVAGSYKTFTANGWYDYIRGVDGTDVGSLGGYAVSADYWFRLKQRRIEFLPEVSFEKYGKTVNNRDFEHQILGLYFNINLYPFDLKSDCDCPTWSKQGNFFTKGFFIQLSPGAWRLTNMISQEQQKMEDKNNTWTLGVGAGLDIGVSDFLTVTPLVRVYHSPNHTWNNLPDVRGEPTKVDSSIQQLYAGIRLGLRWKQDRWPGRR